MRWEDGYQIAAAAVHPAQPGGVCPAARQDGGRLCPLPACAGAGWLRGRSAGDRAAGALPLARLVTNCAACGPAAAPALPACAERRFPALCGALGRQGVSVWPLSLRARAGRFLRVGFSACAGCSSAGGEDRQGRGCISAACAGEMGRRVSDRRRCGHPAQPGGARPQLGRMGAGFALYRPAPVLDGLRGRSAGDRAAGALPLAPAGFTRGIHAHGPRPFCFPRPARARENFLRGYFGAGQRWAPG